MKGVSTLLVLLLAAFAVCQSGHLKPGHSNNVLVLIQPALAGPSVDPLTYWQPQWILWPPVLRSMDGGRLLSVSTGANWVGSPADYQFDSVESGRAWKARSYSLLEARGHFIVQRQMLGDIRTALLVGHKGSASPNALRLALNPGTAIVRPHRIDDSTWPGGELMVAEASGWDEAAEIERSTSGRVLVVEYPPKEDIPWTRYWLKGRGWTVRGVDLASSSERSTVPEQVGLPVPGLIRARLLELLVMKPDRFLPIEVTDRSWPGANRFLHAIRTYGLPLGAIWILTIGAVVLWGVGLVAQERTSQILPVLFTSGLLSPAAVDLAGVLGRFLGVDAWPIWIGISSLALVMTSASIGVLQKQWLPRAHPLLGTYVAGFVTLTLANPIWSFVSPLFAVRTVPVSMISQGAIFGYLVGIVSSIHGCGRRWQWVARAVCGILLVVGGMLGPWWAEDLGAMLFISVAALVVGEDRFRASMLAAFALWPTSFVPIVIGGFIWAPLGLLQRGRDTVGLNAAEYVDFLTSISLWICVTIAVWAALFGYRFFFHQIRKLVLLDARRKALPLAALSGAFFGILHPTFLASSLVVGAGAACALLFDAIQTM